MPHLYSDESAPVLQQLLVEKQQGFESRRWVYQEIEKILGRTLITYFTSFTYPVSIEMRDAQVLEDILRKMDLEKGIALCINSPGGDGVTAERIVKICREYSGTKDFWAIVPGKAKSAATMICMGASKIYMGPVSELGPIDPQITIKKGKDKEDYIRVSAYNFIQGYNNLIKEAVKTKGNLEPYIAQLGKYDESFIERLKSMQKFSEDYAVKVLKSDMMKGKSEKEIKKCIVKFLKPDMTKTHSRPIYRDVAKDCNLDIIDIEKDKKLWDLIYELYIRTDTVVSTDVAKCIETKRFNFYY